MSPFSVTEEYSRNSINSALMILGSFRSWEESSTFTNTSYRHQNFKTTKGRYDTTGWAVYPKSEHVLAVSLNHTSQAWNQRSLAHDGLGDINLHKVSSEAPPETFQTSKLSQLLTGSALLETLALPILKFKFPSLQALFLSWWVTGGLSLVYICFWKSLFVTASQKGWGWKELCRSFSPTPLLPQTTCRCLLRDAPVHHLSGPSLDSLQ